MKKTLKVRKKSLRLQSRSRKKIMKVKINSLLSYIPYILILIKYFLHIDVKVATNFVFKGANHSPWDHSVKFSKSHMTK